VKSVIACPGCGFPKEESMPTDSCQFFYECTNCGVVLRPKPGDCCVYCSYGSVRCPSKRDDVANNHLHPSWWILMETALLERRSPAHQGGTPFLVTPFLIQQALRMTLRQARLPAKTSVGDGLGPEGRRSGPRFSSSVAEPTPPRCLPRVD